MKLCVCVCCVGVEYATAVNENIHITVELRYVNGFGRLENTSNGDSPFIQICFR